MQYGVPVKVVFDTNVLVSALWKPDSKPAQILALLVTNKIHLFYDLSLMAEYRAVLYRSKFRFSDSKTEQLITLLETFGVLVTGVSKSTSPMTDESDRKFYDLAKACGAYLITGNIKHYPKEPLVVLPADFLSFVLS